MNIDHLSRSEFDIECLVRGLKGSSVENYQGLKALLQAEASAPVLVPDRPHPAASKNPRREVQLCGERLKELQNWMQEHTTAKDKEEYIKIDSRLRHIYGRLQRLYDSKAAKSEPAYEIVCAGCKKMFDTIHKAIAEDTTLETSITEITNLTWEGVESPEDSASDSEVPKVVPDKKAQLAAQARDILEGIQKAPVTPPEAPHFDISLGSQTILTDPIIHAIPSGSNGSSSKPSASTINSEKVLTADEELMAILEAIKLRVGSQPEKFPLPKVPITTAPNPVNGLPPRINRPIISESQSNIHLNPSGDRIPDPLCPPSSSSTGDVTARPFNAANPMWAQLEACHSQDFAKGYPSDGSKSLKNWNIQFEGAPGDRNVEKFLFQVEFLANAYNVSLTRLVREISVLLRGEAYNWYWTYIQRNGLVPWPQLRAEFVNMYQDRRTDDDIRRDIESRKQRYEQNETFLSFYNDVLSRSLNFRHTFPDSELLRILRQNMRPGLQIALEGQVIPDLRTLIQRCVSLEDKWKVLHYNPEWGCQPRRQVNEVTFHNDSNSSYHPYSAYMGGSSSSASSDTGMRTQTDPGVDLQVDYHLQASTSPEVCAFTQPPPGSSFPRPNQQSQDRENLSVCWNCKDIGHHYQYCLQPIKRQFCFGCGLPDTYKPNCYRCKAAGNVTPRARFATRSSLPNPPTRCPSPHPSQVTRILQNPAQERQTPPH